MEKEKIKNNWRTATIVLLVIILGLMVIVTYQKSIEEIYDFGSFQISKANFDALAEVSGDEFEICNMEENACVTIQRIPE